jgi:hypothetical protein
VSIGSVIGYRIACGNGNPYFNAEKITGMGTNAATINLYKKDQELYALVVTTYLPLELMAIGITGKVKPIAEVQSSTDVSEMTKVL